MRSMFARAGARLHAKRALHEHRRRSLFVGSGQSCVDAHCIHESCMRGQRVQSLSRACESMTNENACTRHDLTFRMPLSIVPQVSCRLITCLRTALNIS
jgi:hypothetical protein